MSESLVVISFLAPLILAMLWPVRRLRRWIGCCIPIMPLPAVMLVLLGSDCTLDVPWLLLGCQFGLDTTGRVFLGVSAALWLIAGIYGRSSLVDDPQRERLELFWLLAMAGNLGLVLSQDMISYLLLFTLMSVTAYGFVVHDGKPESLRAGRVYITLAIGGEVLLFWAAVVAIDLTGQLTFAEVTRGLVGGPLCSVYLFLLLIGFGIKLGTMPLHFALPLAYTSAPIAAAAVLSGAIVKAGLLGWMRFVPVGEMAMPQWGGIWIGLGTASAFIAAVIGATQRNSKTVLAYSSISQMGLATIGFGAAMTVPDAWPMISVGLLLFVVHHAISKAGLFLGVGVARSALQSRVGRMLVIAGLVIGAASLAGLPLTTGFAAKNGLKAAVARASDEWAAGLAWVLPLSGITTTLLVGRFVYLAWPSQRQPSGQRQSGRRLSFAMAFAWGVLIAAVMLIAIGLPSIEIVPAKWTTPTIAKAWPVIWPLLCAGVVALPFLLARPIGLWFARHPLPAGDIVVPLSDALTWCRRAWDRSVVGGIARMDDGLRERLARYRMPDAGRSLRTIEHRLGEGLIAGTMIGLLMLMMLGLVWFAAA